MAHHKFFVATEANHNDLHADNILFDDELKTAFLIDFGKARRGPEVSFDLFVRTRMH